MLTKLAVHNLGVIRQAPIDLSKSLTIVCGPNGSGKTYLSYIAYAMCNPMLGPYALLSDDEVKSLLDQEPVSINFDKDAIIAFRSMRLSSIKEQLSEIFGISSAQANDLFPDFELIPEENEQTYLDRVIAKEFSQDFTLNGLHCRITKESGPSAVIQFLKVYGNRSILEKNLKLTLMPIIMQMIFGTGIFRPLMLPVERSSIFTFAREIANSRSRLVQSIRRLTSSNTNLDANLFSELINEQASLYPLALNQLFSLSSDMTRVEKMEGDFGELADEIEHSLLHGNLSVSEQGDVVFSPDGSGKKLPMVMGASIVKTLSNLVFFLRHMLSRGDLLIIDEPEINLHPQAQVAMARIIAQMVNHGLRVMVSTHSDYMIREFNNLIMLGNKSEAMEALATRLGYSSDMPLAAQDVAVEAMKFEEDGRIVGRMIPVDRNGVEIAAIDVVTNLLNEVSDEIYFTLTTADD
ncbi:MAG: AAA family ATPase [Muribaculaceae bacterium]|nr:AAA family ATPase [Muribaculaceae bacterium]